MAMVALANPPVRTLRRRAVSRLRRVEKIERKGVASAIRISARVQRSTLAAAGDPRLDPTLAFEIEWALVTPVLARVMLAAYLRGIRDAQLGASAIITLAETVNDDVEFLRRSAGVTSATVLEIEATFTVEAAAILATTGTRIQEAILETLVRSQFEGLHVRAGVSELRKTLARQGITPRSASNLEAIFRTETQKSFAAGRWHFNAQPEIQEILWGYRYITAGDNRVRPTHRGMEGVVLPKNDPFWKQNYPPNGVNCRCQAIELFDAPDHLKPPPDRFKTIQNGKQIEVIPRADPGFRVNFGEVFPDRFGS